MTRIGIAGASGKVSRLVIEEITRAGIELVGGTLRPNATKPAPSGIKIFDSMEALAGACDVVIDFTHADMAIPHAKALRATKRVAWVNGTSGLSNADTAAMRAAAADIPVLHASSFAPTATLVPLLLSQMAKTLPADGYDVEILESHHRHKVDAPSGTAIALGRIVAEARGQDFDAVRIDGRDGHMGPRKTGQIGFGAIRAGEIIGETTVFFFGDSEHITLNRRVFDRRVYASGSLQAALWLAGKAAGFYSMNDVLAGPGR